MAHKRGANWDMVSRRDKGGRKRLFHEHSRDDPPHEFPGQTKRDLKKMMEDAVKNTAAIKVQR